jgi:hypothetical protein
MGELKILAQGTSPQMQAQARGKLFENLMAKVLQNKGYTINFPANSRYTGMEIDIEGKQDVIGMPVYVECKCYEKEVDCSELMKFYAKYIDKWFDESRSQGVFIALSGVNVEAKTFYRERIQRNSKIAFALYEKEDILEVIFSSGLTIKPEIIRERIPTELGTVGDWILLYTDKGFFWAQFIIPPNVGIADSIVIFTGQGDGISDRATIDYLTQLYPDLGSFVTLNVNSSQLSKEASLQDRDEVVEVVGSSSCFEYQFPASPAYFVGRHSILEAVDCFVQDVLNKTTSCRGLLFQGNSGWGKSSSVLECVSRLQKAGHFAIAIDSRSASSSQFILHAVNYALRKFNDSEDPLLQSTQHLTIGGFEDATQSLIAVGKSLEQRNSLLIIFLDQFENIFFKPDIFKRIRDLFLKICDTQTNVILGFSWKNDLIGSMTDLLPFQLQTDIMRSSQRLDLEPFSDMEMAEFLANFSQELHILLNNDLKFFLTDFAQGYPWLLRKLCAHVKAQLDSGISQLDIARSSLNVENLLKEDLRGLSAREEDVLRRIAKVAPVGVRELDDDFNYEIIQILTDKRLLKRIGNKYDISWDILRDYLNSNTLPIRSNYILLAKSGSLLRALHILFAVGGQLEISDFEKQTKLASPTFSQILRDMQRLELIKEDKGTIQLNIGLYENEEDFNKRLQLHLQERLPNNRLISRLLKTLNTEDPLTIDRIADLLAEWSPYMSLAKFTWREYARTFVKLMEAAHLASFDRKKQALTKYKTDAIIVESSVPQARHRVAITMPWAPYTTLERVMEKLYEATTNEEPFDPKLVDLKPNTYAKVLTTLEDLEFVVRKNQDIELLPKGIEFASTPQRRAMLLAESALKIEAFSVFISILETHRKKPEPLTLATELKDRLGADWKDKTAKVYVGILLGWAQHTNLAPHLFNSSQPGAAINEDVSATL